MRARFYTFPWWLQIPLAGATVFASIALAMILTGNWDRFVDDLARGWSGLLSLVGLD